MPKLPRVVIVGFPNVGKSTLFNRILGRRKSLVHADPGMTRDSLTAACTLDDRRFNLVDTGGLFGVADEPLSDQVRARALAEAAAADLVLFVLDGKRDIASAEQELYLQLKRRGLPILLVANKFDSPRQEESMTADYYRLGETNVHFVSAEHNINIGALEEAIVAALPPGGPGAAAEKPLRIAIVGRTNVGKSSIVNRLAGDERLIVSEVPGTTRDSTDTLLVRDGKPFCLVDTAGIRRMAATEDGREKAGIVRAKANIRDADVVCLVLDVQEFPTRQDARIAQLALESGRPLIIVINKWDLVDKAVIRPDAVRDRVFRKLSFVSYAPAALHFGPDRPADRQDPRYGRTALPGRHDQGRNVQAERFPGPDDRGPPAPLEERRPGQAPLYHPEGRFAADLHPVPGLQGPALADLREALHGVPPPGVRLHRNPPPADRPDELSRPGPNPGRPFSLTLGGPSSINKFLSFSVICVGP